MGNSNSSPVNNNYSRKTTNLYTAAPVIADTHSIKFSRNDLLDTISELTLTDVYSKHSNSNSLLLGGSIPTRDRYSQFATTKSMSFNGGGADVANVSSVNSNDIADIKNMILGNQMGGGCGCDKQTSSSYNPLNSMTQPLNGGALYSENSSSSYNPLNSMSPNSDYNADIFIGGGDLSLTSPMNASQVGGNYSATSPMNVGSQVGGNYSATSPMNVGSQVGGNYSATSPMNASQVGGNYSATSVSQSSSNSLVKNSLNNLANQNVMAGGEVNTNSSSFQLGNLSSTAQNSLYSATSTITNSANIAVGGAAEVSSTSSLPINYSNILGGAKNKKNKETKEKEDKSSSSSTPGHLDREMEYDQDASSTSSSPSTGGSTSELARALAETDNSTTRKELSRISAKSKSKGTDSSSSASSSNTSSTSTVSTKDSSSSHTTSESVTPENVMRIGRATNNYMLSSPVSVSANDVVNVKQFYSSESGELYSSNSNYLRNNISKNRLR